MTKKKRILQPINLIMFLIFALVIEAIACKPLFEGANVGLQLAWTGYLLVGILFLFFVGEKIAKVKIIEKYLAGTKAGRILTSSFFFLLCTGIGGMFRLWEMSGSIGPLNKTSMVQLAYYSIICLLAYLTARRISGFRGGAASILLMVLCPFFDFGAEYSITECLYVILSLTAVFAISFANYYVEKKSVSLPDTLLTILGAVSLAGAAFLHISAIFLVFPCIFLLIRKSGLEIRGKREQRGLRSLLFEIFFISSLVVITLIYSVEHHNVRIIELPIDSNFFRVLWNIGKEPLHAFSAISEKCTVLLQGQGEYYYGLLIGMLILGIAGAILLFRKKMERRYFPVYLFNWYFFFSIALKEYVAGGLVFYVLLVYMVSGAVADLSETLFAGKKKQEETAAKEPEIEEVSIEELPAEEQGTEETPVEEEQAEKEQTEPEVETEEEEETEPEVETKEEEETEPEVETEEEEEPEEEEEEPEETENLEAAPIEEQAEPEEEPEPERTEEPKPEIKVGQAEEAEAVLEEPERKAEMLETTAEAEAAPVEEEQMEKAQAEPKKTEASSLEQQVQALINREDRILDIVEKQCEQISRLEEALREEHIRTKKMERHYRKELAITRNKKR